MIDRWIIAAIVGSTGAAALVAAVALGERTPTACLIASATAAPAAVGLAVWARLDRGFPGRALVGGATVGPLIAVAGHAAVAAFAVAFFLGFADAGRSLLETLRVDPTFARLVTSPWLVLAMAEYVVVAPITEEAGKYMGSRIEHPTTRADVFLSGVVAGCGFAMVENVLYAVAAATWGGPWLPVTIVRATGAAVHPLATGLVALGWWDARSRGSRTAYRGSFAGIGVHILWNGTMVALLVIGTVTGPAGTFAAGAVASIVFAATLGVVIGGILWSVTGSVARGEDPVGTIKAQDARPLAAWTVLAASLLVPVALLIFTFPAFRG
jgi:RsiW-degrading membrane proteinase PrsW (M82 family)